MNSFNFRERIVAYFSHNHLFTNFLFFLIIIAGAYAWQVTNKEDLPNIDFDELRISINYSGASPEEIEYFITKPIEEALQSVSGIEEMESTSSKGSSSIRVSLKSADALDQQSTINEIKDSVSSVSLPDDATTPIIRQFKTSEKSILEVALYNPSARLLNFEERDALQKIAYSLENQLTILPEISGVGKTGYLKFETRINIKPEKLKEYDLTLSSVVDILQKYKSRLPLGSLADKEESEVVLASIDYAPTTISNIVVQGNAYQPTVTISDVAEIKYQFHKNTSIIKVDGREAIVLRITKTSDAGIIKAMEAVNRIVSVFEKQHQGDALKITRLGDEAKVVEDRIDLIKQNGIIGFVLIIICLFIFLDFRSSVWVSIGIPFTFAFTMTLIYFTGMTINNVTMAGIIIVMGMVVDDAIIIAENIVRYRQQGWSPQEASIKGTAEIILPVTASILTTCIAFIPLFLMEGRTASLVVGIPMMVIFMLGASLFESIFILPGHMHLTRKNESNTASTLNKSNQLNKPKEKRFRSWITRLENSYGKFLAKLLGMRFVNFVTLVAFFILLGGSLYYGMNHMKFVMFPNEETTEVNLTGVAPIGTLRYQTALLSQKVDDIIAPYLGKEVVGFRTDIARTRRGELAKENVFSTQIEVVSVEEREKSLNELLAELQEGFDSVTNLEITVSKQRFGRASGSPIEVVILNNNDENRLGALAELKESMANDSDLYAVEEMSVLKKEGYEVNLKNNFIQQTKANVAQILDTFRTVLSSKTIDTLDRDGEETDLVVGFADKDKTNSQQLLNISVKSGLTLDKLVEITPTKIAQSINRESSMRISRLYADNEPPQKRVRRGRNLGEKDGKNNAQSGKENGRKDISSKPTQPSKSIKPDKATEVVKSEENKAITPTTPTVYKTALEIAEKYENTVFPRLVAKYPGTTLYFDGEVKESRESTSEFIYILLTVLLLIYFVLVLLFQSLVKPFLIMLIIPFSLIGVILAYHLHGMTLFGFFAVLGFLGLAGVVVNDTIIMISKLDQYQEDYRLETLAEQIANIAKTRLKAILMTTFTTVAGLLPSVYGWAGYDSLLAEMMFVLAWGLLFATFVTLVLVPLLYYFLVKLTKFLELRWSSLSR